MSRLFLVLAFASICCSFVSGSSHVHGTIELDAANFDKVVGKQYDILVKFDKEYPNGEKEDEFKKLVKLVTETDAPNLLLAVVSCADYGEKPNEGLLARFKLQSDGGSSPNPKLPAYVFIKKNSSTAIRRYTGEITANGLGLFLKQEARILLELPGTNKRLDKFAAGFNSSTSDEKQSRISKAETIVKGFTDKREAVDGDFYLKAFKNVEADGLDYIASETARVQKLLKGGSIPDARRRNFERRLNILPSFYVGESDASISSAESNAKKAVGKAASSKSTGTTAADKKADAGAGAAEKAAEKKADAGAKATEATSPPKAAKKKKSTKKKAKKDEL